MSWFFPTPRKIQKNKPYLRQADATLLARSRFEALAIPVSFILCYWQLKTIGLASPVLLSVAVIGTLLCLFRLYHVVMFNRFYARGAQAWRDWMISFSWLGIASWSVFLSLALLAASSVSQLFVLWLSTAVLTMGSTSILAPFLHLLRGNLLLLLLPPALVCLFIWQLEAIICSTVFIGLLVFFWQQAKHLHEEYWDRLSAMHDLKNQASDLKHQMSKNAKDVEVKSDFLANMSHQLRTPLNSLLGVLSLLGDSDLDEEQREYQDVAMRSGDALLCLVNDILDYAQISAKELVLDDAVFNIRRSFDDCIELQASSAHASRIELSPWYASDLPERARGDSVRVRQILSNLINNAVKYSPPGEVAIKVDLQPLNNNKGLLRVEVQDQGTGIDKSAQKRLFEAFASEVDDSEGEHNHTGLGLAICQGLAVKMGGEIGFDCTEKGGNSFWFSCKLDLGCQQIDGFQAAKNLAHKKVLFLDLSTIMAAALKNDFLAWKMSVEIALNADDARLKLLNAKRNNQAFDFLVVNQDFNDADDLDATPCYLFLEDIADKKYTKFGLVVLASLVQRGSLDAHELQQKFSSLRFVTKPIQRRTIHHALRNLSEQSGVGEAEKTANDTKSVRNSHKRVLVVEDNKVNQIVTQGMLKKLGYHVNMVNDGREALGIISDRSFDLVLMDCQMPGLDGYETTREIRKREHRVGKHMHIPIVAMTANAMSGDEARCIAAGMDDYLSKPVNVSEMDNKLRRWLPQQEGASSTARH